LDYIPKHEKFRFDDMVLTYNVIRRLMKDGSSSDNILKALCNKYEIVINQVPRGKKPPAYQTKTISCHKLRTLRKTHHRTQFPCVYTYINRRPKVEPKELDTFDEDKQEGKKKMKIT
jgi:hypothetical protein